MLLGVSWFSSNFFQFQHRRNPGCLPWRIPYVKCGSANTRHSSIQVGEVESVFIKCIIRYLVNLPVLYN